MTAQQTIQKSNELILSSMKRLSQPTDWPTNAPAYHSPEGWALQKQLTNERLKKQIQAKR
jgi:hypothetical protein